MELSGISQWIRWGFPSSLTALKRISQTMRDCHSMLTQNIAYFQSKPVNIPKVTILIDHGYHPDHLTQELEKRYPQIMRKIKFELSTKPSKQEKAAAGKSGFVPAIARLVIERSNAWMEPCKILVKNFERTLSNATAKLNLCFIRLIHRSGNKPE
jgi:hypothetical protein